jgi:O-antigen ligase
MFSSLIMLSISLQKPTSFMIYLETSEKEIAFTWMGRLVADALIILFVASMGLPGKIMAIVTSFFFFVTFGLAQHRPDIFRDLFRAHQNDPSLGESYDAAP